MADQLSSDLASLKIARQETNPDLANRNRNLLIGAGVLVVLLVVAGIVVSRISHSMFKSEVSITSIQLISPSQSSTQVSATGYVVPQHVSKVGAQVAGSVAAVKVKEGDHVKAGDVLVQLDDAAERSALAAARARAAAAKARLATTKTQFDREKRLADQGASPRSTVEDLENQLAAAAADADAADAEAKNLAVNVEHTQIVAPIDGVVVGKPVEVGELVGAGSGPVLEIANFDSMVVETDVPEARLHVVKPGAPAEIVLDAYPDQRLRGEVTEISPRVDRAKATVIVKVKFVDGAAMALPDMAARVSFLTKALEADAMKEPAKLYVPGSAVADRDGRKVVFVVDENEKVHAESVTLGDAMASGWELKNGPRDGTKVVANPPEYLADGQKVKERED